MINLNSTSRLVRALLGAATLVAALGVSQQAVAGIATTKHNLGSAGTGVNHATTGTTEICVFCHTPHASNTGVAAPLWNKALPGTSYTTYSTANSATIDGEVLAVGSISLACLSCHDGTQAMDNFVNAPGSGAGTFGTPGTGTAGYTWTGANQTAGKITGVANLGADLTNDHPIGIQYCGGGPNAAAPSAGCKDPDFFAPASATINSTLVFWVDTLALPGNGRQKTDMILYNRSFGSGTLAGAGPSVECGSCHDPHVDSLATDGLYFMRVTTAGSAICLACHNK